MDSIRNCERCRKVVSKSDISKTYVCCKRTIGRRRTWCEDCITEIECNACTTKGYGIIIK